MCPIETAWGSTMAHLPRSDGSRGRAIRLPAVCALTGASRSTIWRWVDAETTFPKPFHLSPAITVWDEAEVLAWLAAKKQQERAA
jgi:predicted DNA-binding transcriptional regulator AlpA